MAGRFTPAAYDSLLFYEGSTGYGELWDTNGQGGLSGTSPIGGWTRAALGDQIWTHVVPGYFGTSSCMGLLLFDRTTGTSAFYDHDGAGTLRLLQQNTGWRTSWRDILPVYVSGNDNIRTGLLFYSPSEGQAEIWLTDGAGNITPFLEHGPYNVGTNWTHVVCGDFIDNGNFDQFTDVFFYDATTGLGRLYYRRADADRQLLDGGFVDTGVPGATHVLAGNFGVGYKTGVLLYKQSTGAISLHGFAGDAASFVLLQHETQTYPRSTANIVVAADLWRSNVEDGWFFQGDNVSDEEIRNARANGAWFTDLLFYNASLGLGEAYFHEPAIAPPDALTGYITSTTNHGGTSVSTGSVAPGETIAFHVSSQVGPYTITLYRAVDIGGKVLGQITGLPSSPSPLAIQRNAYQNGAQWPAVGQPFTIPAGWASDLYVARVQAAKPEDFVDLPFVVRKATPASQSKILVVITDTTYEAYNDWGGRGLYGFSNTVDRGGSPHPQSGSRAPYAFHVSFDRAHDGRYETHGARWTFWEVPLLSWLSRHGVAVEVCTSRDLHFEAPSPSYRLLAFSGHHEYWSREMRDHAEAFAFNGGNLAFFSGNVCWWQVRLSGDGRQMTCYKNATFDPLHNSQPALTTTNWYLPPVKRPETSLTGVSYLAADGIVDWGQNQGTPQFTCQIPLDWVFRGTGIQAGSQYGAYGNGSQTVVGPETDRLQPSSPTNFVVLGTASLCLSNGVCSPAAAMGTFTPNGGVSRVFTAATMNWSLGLDLGGSAWGAVDQITLNVVSQLSDGDDLALSATATASSALSSSPPTRLVDGNRVEYYSSNTVQNDPSKGVDHTEWVALQLPASKTISTVILYPRCDAPNAETGFPIDFRVQVWNGTSWLDRVIATSYAAPGSRRQVFTWGHSDITDRIRVLATHLPKLADGSFVLQLAQISIY